MKQIKIRIFKYYIFLEKRKSIMLDECKQCERISLFSDQYGIIRQF